MDYWVDLRKQIIKRPFMATLERFVNPICAEIIIASAFHPQYGEKMLTICERAGFNKAIFIRNGLEGTIAFPLKRSAKILCTKKMINNKYERFEFEYHAEKELNYSFAIEEKLTNPSLDKNKELIEEYMKEGKTSYALFDQRIKATCAGIKKALEWVEQN